MSARQNTRPRRFQLLTSRGLVRVIVCPLCAALVLAAGHKRHDAAHRAQLTA